MRQACKKHTEVISPAWEAYHRANLAELSKSAGGKRELWESGRFRSVGSKTARKKSHLETEKTIVWSGIIFSYKAAVDWG